MLQDRGLVNISHNRIFGALPLTIEGYFSIQRRRRKKARGIFYTPDFLSEILAEWAITSKEDTILEPSFGGCVFIAAALARLQKLKAPTAQQNLYGCDLDANAFKALTKIFGIKPAKSHFIKDDFLKVDSTSFSGKQFSVIIGNPPYVSRHNMPKRQRDAVDRFISLSEVTCPSTGSLWSYFVLHAISFLRERGRLAFVLPGSLLNSQYGRSVLETLQLSFLHTSVISLQERLFFSEGTDESTVVLLCEDKGILSTPGNLYLTEVKTLLDLKSHIIDQKTYKKNASTILNRSSRFFEAEADFENFNLLASSTFSSVLGSHARVSIGIVTGANDFFVVNKTLAEQQSLPFQSLPRILSKFKCAKGLELTTADIRAQLEADERCILVTASKFPRSGPLRSYFRSFPKSLKEDNKTFKKREKWFHPGTETKPDGFLSYMHHYGPRMTINKAGINSTNTIHRVFFHPGTTDLLRRIITISLLSTFSQLSAEITGRNYGSGILKHEPSEAMAIQLLIPTTVSEDIVANTYSAIDTSLRAGLLSEASQHADSFLTSTCDIPDLSKRLTDLQKALMHARRLRIPTRKCRQITSLLT